MPPQILFSPRQPENIMAIVRELAPPGFDLVPVDPGTPEFYEAAAGAEYYMGLARQMGGEFFRTAPRLKLVQLLSAGYDRVDLEAVGLGLLDAARIRAQADYDTDARVVEVERVRVALGAVAEDGNGLALEQREVGIVVVDHSGEFHSASTLVVAVLRH